ncbi:hypothetical protein ACIPUC_14475 [Streptomyces sp. LARHCF249]
MNQLARRARQRIMKVTAALAAAAAFVVWSTGPAQAGTAEVRRTLTLTDRPDMNDYASTNVRYIYLEADYYLWEVLLFDERSQQIVPGSRQQRAIWLRAGTYAWDCAIGGTDGYLYRNWCTLSAGTDRAQVGPTTFGIGSSGSHTLIGRLIGT